MCTIKLTSNCGDILDYLHKLVSLVGGILLSNDILSFTVSVGDGTAYPLILINDFLVMDF